MENKSKDIRRGFIFPPKKRNNKKKKLFSCLTKRKTAGEFSDVILEIQQAEAAASSVFPSLPARPTTASVNPSMLLFHTAPDARH